MRRGWCCWSTPRGDLWLLNNYAVFDDQEIQFGLLMDGPEEGLLGCGAGGTDDFFQREALPGSSQFGVNQQLVIARDAEQGMQQAGVADIDLRALYLALADVHQ